MGLIVPSSTGVPVGFFWAGWCRFPFQGTSLSQLVGTMSRYEYWVKSQRCSFTSDMTVGQSGLCTLVYLFVKWAQS